MEEKRIKSEWSTLDEWKFKEVHRKCREGLGRWEGPLRRAS